MSAAGYVVGNQLFDVLNKLPAYKANLHTKIESLRGRPGGGLAKATESVQELSKELAPPKPQGPLILPAGHPAGPHPPRPDLPGVGRFAG